MSDASGVVIYSGTVNYDGDLTALFDFTQLKDGTYTIEINKDFEIEVSTIEVKNHIVSYLGEAVQLIHKPVFRLEKDKVLISKLAMDAHEMDVELYYGEELIYSETVKADAVINRVYKLDQNLSGDYTAVINADGRVYVENFSI